MRLIQQLEAKDKALKVHEVAKLFEISKQHVYEMAADGTMPAFHIGRSIRFDPQDLADWLRERNPKLIKSGSAHAKAYHAKPDRGRKSGTMKYFENESKG
jgi:excisionase family DNA binding protein